MPWLAWLKGWCTFKTSRYAPGGHKIHWPLEALTLLKHVDKDCAFVHNKTSLTTLLSFLESIPSDPHSLQYLSRSNLSICACHSSCRWYFIGMPWLAWLKGWCTFKTSRYAPGGHKIHWPLEALTLLKHVDKDCAFVHNKTSLTTLLSALPNRSSHWLASHLWKSEILNKLQYLPFHIHSTLQTSPGCMLPGQLVNHWLLSQQSEDEWLKTNHI